MNAKTELDNRVEEVIANVKRFTNIDGMNGDSWDRILVRHALISSDKRAARALDLLDAVESGEVVLMEWQSIETAPKDGRRICIKFANGKKCEASWRNTYGGEWHVDSYTHLPWADQKEITQWMPLSALLSGRNSAAAPSPEGHTVELLSEEGNG